MQGQLTMLFPKPLSTGDKVAIVSPASAVRPAYIDAARATLSGWGYIPSEGRHCRDTRGTYSGTAEQRAADLREALTDPEVRAVLCSRGGYGAVHLLDSLPYDAIKAAPKWIIGFSDISALHAAMVSAGVASLHAPMAKQFACGSGESLEMVRQILQGGLPSYSEPPHPLNRVGQAQGQIVGGNMAVLCALIGTPYHMLKPGRILFIEDVGEAVYRIERLLHNLRLCGTLARIKGLIVGQFTEYASPDGNGETMEAMIRRMVEPYDFPVAFGFPVGHVDRNLPLIEGATARLSVTPAATTLQYTT